MKKLFFKKMIYPMRYYVYVLQSEIDGKFYVGYTENLEQRFKEHNEGKVISTRKRKPLKLVYYKFCFNQTDATIREKYLKTAWGKRHIKNRIKNYHGVNLMKKKR